MTSADTHGWSSLLITVAGRKRSAKTSSRRKERPRRHSHVRLYSMLITMALLSIILAASYSALQPRVETLPATVPFRYENWMAFVPSSAEFVAYVNYRACIETSGNQSLFGVDPLLEIYLPTFLIFPQSIEYEIAISLPSEGSKEVSPTVSVLKIDSQELRNFQEALQSSTKLRRTNHGAYTIYDLLIRHKERQTQLVSAILTIAHEDIVFAEGAGTMTLMAQVLEAADNPPSQLFSSETARTALYASGGAGGDYLAFFAATFPTQIEGATILTKTVRGAPGTVASQLAISFDSQDKARSQYQAVKNLYTGGRDYWILGQFVVVKFSYQMSELDQQIRGL
jgi:hypothetical protein